MIDPVSAKAVCCFRLSCLFALGLTVNGCTQPLRTTTAATIVVPCVEGKVSPWRVTANGDHHRLPIVLESSRSGVAGHWQMCPLVSPDRRAIAFTKSGDIWVYEVASGEQRQMTSVGRSATATHASVFAAPHLWSADSRQLLYYVDHPDLQDPEGYQPSLLAWEAPYGPNVLEIATRHSALLKLDEEIEAWLPDGRLLFQPHMVPPTEGSLWIYDAATGRKRQLTERPCWYLHTALSPDGQRLQYVCGTRMGNQDASQVQELVLKAGEVKELSEVAGWAEFNWPSYSPNGKRAFIRRTTKVPRPRESLEILGRHIVDCDGYGRNEWLDEHTVVWRCGDEMAVVNISSGTKVATFEPH